MHLTLLTSDYKRHTDLMFHFTATIPAVIILSEGENNLEAFYITTAHRTKTLPLYLHLYINLAIATSLDRQ